MFLGPKNELRTIRWLASTTTTIIQTSPASTSAPPRGIGACPGISSASSIHGWKTERRSFASEPVTREEKKQKEEREGDDEDSSTSTAPSSSTSTSPATTSWSFAGWSLEACATLPNAISAARALSAPFLFHAISHGNWGAASCLLAFGAVSDCADGASARFLDKRRLRREEPNSSPPSSSSSSSSAAAAAAAASSSSSSSPLGTYLDPLADKIFIGAAVAAAAGWGGGDGGGGFPALEGGPAAEAVDSDDSSPSSSSSSSSSSSPQNCRRWPLLPGWLAAAIIGRDVLLVGGSLFARLRQFEGGRWPGGPELFRLVDNDGDGGGGEAKKAKNEARPPSSSSSSSSSSSAVPRIRPLFVSKINTALQFATIGAAVADSGGWLEGAIEEARSLLSSSSSSTTTTGGGGEGASAAVAAAADIAGKLTGSDVVAALAAATAAMTAVSGWAYASAYLRGRRKT